MLQYKLCLQSLPPIPLPPIWVHCTNKMLGSLKKNNFSNLLLICCNSIKQRLNIFITFSSVPGSSLLSGSQGTAQGFQLTHPTPDSNPLWPHSSSFVLPQVRSSQGFQHRGASYLPGRRWGDPGQAFPAFVLGEGCCFLYDFNFSLVN